MTLPLSDFSLNMFTPAVQGISPIMSLDGIAIGWKRSTRLQGGFWQGSFEVVAHPDTLVEYYESWLGNHIEETSGGGNKSWEGLIYELEIQQGNIARRKSFDDMANKVACNYEDGRTAFSSNTASQSLYGIKEEVIDYGGAGSDGGTQMRDTYLKRFAFPKSNPVGPVTAFGGVTLRVLVCGYIFTLNWKHATVNVTNTALSTIVTSILTDDSEFLTAGKIDGNAQQASIEADIGNADHTPQRAWDLIADTIIPMGDSSGDIWRFYVDTGRLAFYNELSMAPNYYVKNGMVTYTSSQDLSIPPWWVLPGVYRDLDFRLFGQEEDSIYNDRRDFIVEEVEVSSNGGIALKSLGYDDSDFVASLQNYMTLATTGGGGGGGTTNKWHWPDMSPEERAWYTAHNGDMSGYPG